jgi:hypothetical protein
MLSEVREIRKWQIALYVFSLITIVVYFIETNKPLITSLDDAKNAAGQVLLLKGRNTPIIKTNEKAEYPADMEGFHISMRKAPLRLVKLDDADLPLYASRWGISQRSKITVTVKQIDAAAKEQLNLNAFYNEHPEYTGDDFILIERPAWLMRILIIFVFFISYKCMTLGIKRQVENARM